MKNKKLILAAVAVVAVIAIMAGIWFATRPQTEDGGKTITVTIVHKDGAKNVKTLETEQEFLSQALLDEKLIEPSNDGRYNTIDGVTADYSVDQSYWAVFIGEDYAMVGMDEIPVTDGGVYSIVYTVYSES